MKQAHSELDTWENDLKTLNEDILKDSIITNPIKLQNEKIDQDGNIIFYLEHTDLNNVYSQNEKNRHAIEKFIHNMEKNNKKNDHTLNSIISKLSRSQNQLNVVKTNTKHALDRNLKMNGKKFHENPANLVQDFLRWN